MPGRVRIKPVRDATKDLKYISDYLEEWKGEEYVRPIAAHQSRYAMIEMLVRFPIEKLDSEIIRYDGGTKSAEDNGDGEQEAVDHQDEDGESGDDS